jgi:cysteinyl-tRNA synthetase
MKRIDKLISSIQSVLAASPSPCNPPDRSEAVEPDLLLSLIESCKTDFETAMCDDFNTPRAIASLFRLVGAVEKAIGNSTYSNVISVGIDTASTSLHNFTSTQAKSALAVISAMDSVLGFLYDVPPDYFQRGSYDEESAIGGCTECSGSHSSGPQLEMVLAQVRELAEKRRDLKKNKQFKEADEIRGKVAELGYGIKDTKDGYDVFLL